LVLAALAVAVLEVKTLARLLYKVLTILVAAVAEVKRLVEGHRQEKEVLVL
jgi:hypothetical protein